MPRAAIRTIIATGDLTAETDPTSRHYCHMYRAAELRAFLEKPGRTVEQISASSALATGVETEFITTAEQWEAWLEYEAVACVEPGYLDAGTHLLAAVRRGSLAALPQPGLRQPAGQGSRNLKTPDGPVRLCAPVCRWAR